MTIHAYPEIYISKAQATMGDAFDYAINVCGVPGDKFVKMLSVCDTGKRMELGEPAVISGKSGIEAAMDIIFETEGEQVTVEIQNRFTRSKEYWIGWAVCYYQWLSCRKFSEIFKAVSYEDFENMYYTLHEADISKFAEIVDRRIKECFSETNLKRMRMVSGMSQSELAKSSGVSLRSIQMYEQRNKDINKAGAESLFRLARALGCTMEDLIEKSI